MSEKFETWAIVELFGHQKIAGRVAEQQIAGTMMLRVDVPEENGHAGFTRIYGGSAIYSITPTDEDTARAAVNVLQIRPITVYGVVAPERQIQASLDLDGHPDDDYLEDDEYPDEDDDRDEGDYPDEDGDDDEECFYV